MILPYLDEDNLLQTLVYDGLGDLEPLAGSDGELTIESIEQALNGSKHDGWLDLLSISQAMCWGCGGESLMMSIEVPEYDPAEIPLFNYESLALLTDDAIEEPRTAAALARAVAKAGLLNEQGDFSFRDAVLQQYGDIVGKLDPRLITVRNRQSLIHFKDILISSYQIGGGGGDIPLE